MTEEVKRGRGRPKKVVDPDRTTIDLERTQKKALRLLAADAEMSLSDMIRMILDEYINEWKELRPDLLNKLHKGTVEVGDV